MKNSMLITCTVVAIFCLTAFGFMDMKDPVAPDLIYKVESRFMTRITKENLDKAQFLVDIYPEKATQSIASYQANKVVILHEGQEITAVGEGNELNGAQIMLLQLADYATDFYIRADCKKKNDYTGALEDDYIVYYMTIVPEKEAAYIEGQDALIDYLKQGSKEETAIIKQDKLQPGKVNFTVTKEGTIEHATLSSTSGYPSVDEALIELISNIPGEWEPATNSKGEKVEQKFVFFFGLMGC